MIEEWDPPLTGRSSADYVLRTAQQNMVQLSAMADQKASVVLGSSFVVATIAFADSGALAEVTTANLVLAVTAVTAGILAAVALFPKLSPGAGGATSNPLFFGSIARIEPDAYHQEMRGVLTRDERIYRAIIDDLHQASVILLHRKYRWLQASYVTLIAGMVAALIAALAF